MPVQASKEAVGVDHLYAFLLISSLISFVILIGGMTWFIFKYRRKTENDKTAYITHNTLAEFIWSFVPLVVLLAIFFWGWAVLSDLRKTGVKGDVEIHVTARQWSWAFQYQDGISITSPSGDHFESDTAKSTLLKPAIVTVPVDQTVRLVMTSVDVLHSFYVPAFRNKMDVVPGRRTTFTFKPTQKGDFTVFCTEYCGTSHSNMMATIRVVGSEEFQAWKTAEEEKLKASLSATPADKGLALYNSKGCNSCHTVDGTPRVGPSFKGIYGSKKQFADGSAGSADDNYIQQSILVPNAKVVKGFPPVMPSFQGQLSNEDIQNIIEYFKTLK
ncbi:cytochrome c oxidase subunit II [Leptospira perolatii]|uniref:Cytochrome c oxidase subunit 2 n=2 Tax=Leptospira perolatii TaxID=2023191 RepID=A0A2M9ZTF6_9LEPT|nr:cytochrome c oxidase subunit II [Leptospira perolatii]PJZ75193.1 cytochrome c oxidase subunit II [Leptospira perolatii]